MDSIKVGNFITKLRKSKGLTQVELAKSINVTNKAISKWETGNGLPDVGLLYPLASALGVSVTELLAGEFMEGEKFNKSNADEVTLRTLYYNKKKFMKTIRIIIISAILAIALVCLGWYFITSFNSIRVYRIKLDSENFWMNDGFFMKSNMKNVFQLTDLKYIGEEKLENNEFRTKIYVKDEENNDELEEKLENNEFRTKIYVKDEENNDELIIYDGIYVSPVNIYETDGYDEYFTDIYAKILKDNINIDIRYINEEGKIVKETHKLETTLEFANNKILELKESSKDSLNVSDSVNSFRKRKTIQEKLLNDDFEICAEDDNLGEDCFVKEADDTEVIVYIANDNIISINSDGKKLYYNSGTNLVRLMEGSSIVYSKEYSILAKEKIHDKNKLQLVNLLTKTLDLLNG